MKYAVRGTLDTGVLDVAEEVAGQKRQLALPIIYCMWRTMGLLQTTVCPALRNTKKRRAATERETKRDSLPLQTLMTLGCTVVSL